MPLKTIYPTRPSYDEQPDRDQRVRSKLPEWTQRLFSEDVMAGAFLSSTAINKMRLKLSVCSRLNTFCWQVLWPWILVWLGVAAIILVGVLYLDHPLALYLLENTSRARPVRLLIRVPEALAVLAITSTLLIGIWWLLKGQLGVGLRQALGAGLGICVALAAKTELKLVFGRVAPDAWVWHQSAPLRNFHFLHSGSFPSGHMVVMGVLTAFLWPYGRVVRAGWLLLCFASGAALMMMGAHFFTDLIAGAMLGLSIGAACRYIAMQTTRLGSNTNRPNF